MQRDDLDQRRECLTALMREVGDFYLRTGAVSQVEIVANGDVHVYLQYASDPTRGIHLQAFPGLSRPWCARLSASEVDWTTLPGAGTEDRRYGRVHHAVRRLLPQVSQMSQLYDAFTIERQLERDVPELRGHDEHTPLEPPVRRAA